MAESKDIKVSKKITREEWKRADAAVYRIMRKYKNKSGSDPDFVRELQAANPHHPSYNLDNLDNLGKLGKKGDEKAKNQKVTTTEEKTPEVTPAKKKLTEAVNVLSGNQVSQGVIEGTGESIGTKYSNRLFGEKTEKKSKKNKKKRGR